MATKKERKERPPYEPKVPDDVWALPDGHHSGYSTGFEKQGDAVYPAPTHTEPMDAIRLDREALNAFVDAMNAHVHREFQKIARREDKWWTTVEQDLGIKRGTANYFYFEKCFKRPQSPPASATKADAVDPAGGRVTD